MPVVYGVLAALWIAVAANPMGVSADTATTSVTIIIPECSDSADNDGDGLIDFPADPGCGGASDDDETNEVFACNDSTDNDGDGLIDFPADPGCDSATDNNETDVSSGGGGGGRASVNPTIRFSGLAHPFGDVFFLQDGVRAAVFEAGDNARFSFEREDVTAGEYLFTFYGVDASGRKSGLLSFTVSVPDVEIVIVENVFIPPTLSADEVGEGTVLLQGTTVPLSTVIFALFDLGVPIGERETRAGGDGSFRDTILFQSSRLVAKAKSVVDGLESPFGTATRVGGKDIREVDVNEDGKIDLVDFSILAYWYKRDNPPSRFDLNSDGAVDLTDVSILAFYWTG